MLDAYKASVEPCEGASLEAVTGGGASASPSSELRGRTVGLEMSTVQESKRWLVNTADAAYTELRLAQVVGNVGAASYADACIVHQWSRSPERTCSCSPGHSVSGVERWTFPRGLSSSTDSRQRLTPPSARLLSSGSGTCSAMLSLVPRSGSLDVYLVIHRLRRLLPGRSVTQSQGESADFLQDPFFEEISTDDAREAH